MVRASLAVLGGLTLAALVIAVSSNTASAQTTFNQTTCVPGPNSCLTNGFLQSINVDCAAGQSIANALASITDRNGPNRILISGSCQQPLTVAGYNRLTFEGAAGATITRGWTFVNSRQITLRSLIFDFNGFPTRMIMNGANVVLDGTTIRESGDTETAVKMFSDSHLFSSANAPSVITENAGNGVDVDGGSLFTAQNITISHNGWRGIYARNGATVALANHVFVNGVLVDTPVDISFNQSNGIELENGTITTSAEQGNALIHIHDNDNAALDANGFVDLEGNVKIENNGPGDFGDYEVTIAAGTLTLGQGTEIVGPILAFRGAVFLGSGGPITHTGGVELITGSVGVVVNGTTVDQMDCDDSSWVQFFDGGTITTNNCPVDAPMGTPGLPGEQGPPGIQGPPGPQGVPGVSGRQVAQSAVTQAVAAGALVSRTVVCPAGKTVLSGGGFASNPNVLMTGSLPSSATSWTALFRNITAAVQNGNLTVMAVCATVP